jgi:hypothetical protein
VIDKKSQLMGVKPRYYLVYLYTVCLTKYSGVPDVHETLAEEGSMSAFEVAAQQRAVLLFHAVQGEHGLGCIDGDALPPDGDGPWLVDDNPTLARDAVGPSTQTTCIDIDSSELPESSWPASCKLALAAVGFAQDTGIAYKPLQTFRLRKRGTHPDDQQHVREALPNHRAQDAPAPIIRQIQIRDTGIRSSRHSGG